MFYDSGEREETCLEQVEEGSAICGVIHSSSSATVTQGIREHSGRGGGDMVELWKFSSNCSDFLSEENNRVMS